jgi:hypothetical protein
MAWGVIGVDPNRGKKFEPTQNGSWAEDERGVGRYVGESGRRVGKGGGNEACDSDGDGAWLDDPLSPTYDEAAAYRSAGLLRGDDAAARAHRQRLRSRVGTKGGGRGGEGVGGNEGGGRAGGEGRGGGGRGNKGRGSTDRNPPSTCMSFMPPVLDCTSTGPDGLLSGGGWFGTSCLRMSEEELDAYAEACEHAPAKAKETAGDDHQSMARALQQWQQQQPSQPPEQQKPHSRREREGQQPHQHQAPPDGRTLAAAASGPTGFHTRKVKLQHHSGERGPAADPPDLRRASPPPARTVGGGTGTPAGAVTWL